MTRKEVRAILNECFPDASEETVNAAISKVMASHVTTTDALKESLETEKLKADKVAELTRQLNEANEKLSKAGDSAKVQAEFDAYKASVEKEKTAARKGDALNKLLEKAGITRQAFRDLIRKGYDLDKLELLEDGSAKDADKLVEAIKTDYADFVGEVKTEGTGKNNPPSGGGGGKKTWDEIRSIEDRAERRAAIAEAMKNEKE